MAAAVRAPPRAGHRHALRRRVAGRAPRAAGIDAWPVVPRGRAVEGGRDRRASASRATPGEFWRTLLGQVSTYADLDPALVGAVEQLIDFVTTSDG